jgi:hypothetical protein
MKEYKINEIFQWEDRTLMCVEGYGCGDCYLDGQYCSGHDRIDGKDSYFTNKLIFSTKGLTLQIKRKSCKVKVKVLELSEEFERIENDNFEIYYTSTLTHLHRVYLAIHKVNDKWKNIFPTEQEAIDWVDGLFSLRGE